jgi:hypothetical protein
MTSLEEKTGINDFSPGSIARSLLEVFNEHLYGAYEDFDVFISNIYLSSAEGAYLDMLGKLLNCTRRPGEEDDNYRYRISNQAFSAAKSNETALRLACLSVDGVKDVVMNKFTKGSGSFTVHVITDEVLTPDSVIDEVRAVVDQNKAEGVSATVTGPNPVGLDITFSLKLYSNPTDEGRSLSGQIKTSIQEYIDDLGMGSSISIQKILSIATLNESVKNAFLTDFKVNEEAIVIRDQYLLEWDERPYVDSVSIQII